MAQFFFSIPLGGRKSEAHSGASTTAGDAVEVRIDEGQTINLHQIDDAIIRLRELIAEAQRYS